MGGKPRKQPEGPVKPVVKVDGKTVALEDLSKLCHGCGNLKAWRRTIYTHNYEGSCGDSFCYASCDMSACKPQTMQICTECVPKYGREPR